MILSRRHGGSRSACWLSPALGPGPPLISAVHACRLAVPQGGCKRALHADPYYSDCTAGIMVTGRTRQVTDVLPTPSSPLASVSSASRVLRIHVRCECHRS